MPTNKELIAELTELGITPSPDANNAQLKKLLKSAKEPSTPARISNDAASETVATPPRITSSGAAKQPAEQEPRDYLRQYQYRKETKFGSPQSDPQPGTKAELMKQNLLSQPKIRIFIPRPQGEDKSILQSVTLNGYRLDLPKNAYIDLPQQIADVLMESLQQTEQAILRGQIAGDKQKEDALL